MPIIVRGVVETKQALRKFAPDLKRSLDAEARSFLKVMVSDAKGFVPKESPLSGWQINTKGRAITAQTSAFSGRAFPLFQTAEIKAGLVSKVGGMKTTRTGFKAEYALQNKSAAGAIYETAGRINPGISGIKGLPWVGPKASPTDRKVSHSRNPKAGQQFIDAIDRTDNYRQIKGRKDGRLIFRAVEKDNGKAVRGITNAVLNSEKLLQARLNIRKAFGGDLA
ncbi:hypothetical protein UFOVP1648_3 [uncultured Caudovirales phage]|uniref:Uncharacterized protein n=1 Tax=uncultured Caudovirales phage TaxID=2100421 RepID=A0A6J5T4N6_9CAUD|nr:hypothetical protein UFOVP1648_3 [uncultured Caudovirales phage]